MASKLNQPTGFIKLTNVAFIKYKVDKVKFEIACYKNKAINWRNGVEKDISEVLQSEEIYENATHGIICKKDQLSKVFPKMSKMDIIKMILDKGDLQVSEKEREVQMSNLQNDIINFIQEKVVHPDSQRQFSLEQISSAIQDIHFNLKSDQPAKKQALICIQQLQKKYHITRAKMKIGITARQKDFEKLEDLCFDLQIKEKKTQQINEKEILYALTIEPQLYRPLIDGVKKLNIPITTEVLENNIVNKTVQDISDTENIELKVREDWVENQEQDQQDQEDQQAQKTKNKKQRKKQNAKLMREQQEKEKKEKEQKMQQFLNNQGGLDFTEVNRALLAEKEALMKKKSEEEQKKDDNEQEEEKKEQEIPKNAKKCTTCKEAYFVDPAEFRQHFKSEWHVCNVKRKTQQLPPFSKQEYQVMQLDEEFNKN